jgi:hypothetical protein
VIHNHWVDVLTRFRHQVFVVLQIIILNVSKKLDAVIFIFCTESRSTPLWSLWIVASLDNRAVFHFFSAATIEAENLTWRIGISLEVRLHSPFDRILNRTRVSDIYPCPLILYTFIILPDTSSILAFNWRIKRTWLIDKGTNKVFRRMWLTFYETESFLCYAFTS